MTRSAVAYIRRSASHESPLSREAQRAAVAAAAAARGDAITHEYTDWGRSGGDRSRPAFLQMLEAVEAGTVSAVYTYDADRLSRRESTLHLLLDAAEDTGTAVVDRTGRDLADRHYRLTAGVLASVDAQVLRDITERNRSNRDRRRARGDDFGEPPLGYTKVRLTEAGLNASGMPAQPGATVNVLVDEAAITTVLNAYHAAGSTLGAAVLLNAAGIRTRRGKTWGNRAVYDVVSREAPELLPPRLGRRAARHYRVRVLSGLLRCRCGTLLSPNGTGWTCTMGARGAHERPYNLTGQLALRWAREEWSHLQLPGSVVVDTTPAAYDDTPARERLLALRGLVSDAVVDAGLAELDAARAAATTERSEALAAVPHDWAGLDEANLNAALRALWHHIQLGDDMRPVAAVWRYPELRTP